MFRYPYLIYLLIVFFFVVNVEVSKSQNNAFDEVSISSPNAASLGKFVDIPVNYHTGIPEVSIPLYEINEGPLNLPISLKYHASGVKVMELSSWVGNGWALNAGGVITRTVRGGPDDKGDIGQTHGHFTDYGFSNYPLDMYFEENFNSSWAEIEQGVRDGEPDLFVFNFNGYGGKFYFNDDRKPILVPDSDLEIIPVLNSSENIIGFTIITPNGVKYKFGIGGEELVSPVEYSSFVLEDFGYEDSSVISSWYLYEISSSDSKYKITLEYEKEEYGYFNISMFPIDGNSSQTVNEFKLIKNIVDGVRLKRINFSNGAIEFVPGNSRVDLAGTSVGLFDDSNSGSNSAKSLSAIKILRSSGGSVKEFEFSYDYFEDNITDIPSKLTSTSIISDSKKLKLTEVQEKTGDGLIELPPYKFKYHGNFLVRRLSFAQDHWGFYNGEISNTNLIPSYTVINSGTIEGANRDSKWPEVENGALYQVEYPTGGRIEFEYEPNKIYVNDINYIPTDFFVESLLGTSIVYKEEQVEISSQNQYPWTMSTSDGNGYSRLIVENSNGESVASFSVLPNSTENGYLDLEDGTYTLKYELINSTSGQYSNIIVKEEGLKSFHGEKIVGGLRVKKKTLYDPVNDKSIVKQFEYENLADSRLTYPNESTGVLFSRPTYVQIIRNDILKWAGFDTDGPQNPDGCRNLSIGNMDYYKSPSSIRPMDNTIGYHIGYSKVKVKEIGNGFSVFEYYLGDLNEQDIYDKYVDISTCSLSIPNFPASPLSYDFKRGQIKSKNKHKESGDLVKNISYDYSYLYRQIGTYGFIVKTIDGMKYGTLYQLKSGKKTNESIVTKTFDGGNYIVDTLKSFYSNEKHNQVTEIINKSSKGNNIKTKFKYAIEYSNCNNISNSCDEFLNDINVCEQTFYTNYYNCETGTCKYNAWQDYFNCKIQSRKNYVNCRINYNENFDSCISYDYQGSSQFLSIQNLLKNYRNPIVEQIIYNNEKIINAKYFEYGPSLDDQNLIYPYKLFLLEIPDNYLVFVPSYVDGNDIIVSDDYFNKSEILYKNGRLISKNSNDQLKESSFIWGYNGTKVISKISNSHHSKVSHTSFETDENGGWNYSGNPINSSNAKTGEKVYNLSNGSISTSGFGGSSSDPFTVFFWARRIAGSGAWNVLGESVELGTEWKLIERTVTSNSITLSGSDIYIDELRLHPNDAQMTTYTYDPLIGITSQTDPNGTTTYYEYDGFGRLSLVRDNDGNILKSYVYNYQ